MPILTRFPGGGGATGYKYQSEGAGGITYSKDAEGVLLLKWTDPADMVLDGRALSEWKGTIVVCKEGSPPQSVDDGTIVCDSTVRDQYRATGLPVDIGGPGYYYGVFPYTKDYVVNVDSANTVYVLSGGYDTALGNASWSDIAYISSEGKASQIWAVRDEIDLPLSGEYNESITMQIIGFDHDDLIGGGKAGITFFSKQQITGSEKMNLSYTNAGGWRDTYMRGTVMPKIRSSLPQAVQNAIKKVKKLCTLGYGRSNQDLVAVEDDLFLLSSTEVGYFGAGNLYHIAGEGVRYPAFTSQADLTSKGSPFWWLRSAPYYFDDYFGVVRPDYGDIFNQTATKTHGVRFGFCI